jgi:hypothetical protein
MKQKYGRKALSKKWRQKDKTGQGNSGKKMEAKK